MLWAALIIGAFVTMGSVITCAVVAVLVSQRLSDAFRTISTVHARSSKTFDKATDKLLNRLMAIRWEDYVALHSVTVEESEGEEGFFAPEDLRPPSEDEEEGGMTWPHLRRPEELTEDERELLDEDFDEEDSPRRVI